MSDFEREERYIVVKIKDLKYESVVNKLHRMLKDAGIPTRECVVVEPDWPIYEQVWSMVQALAEGEPAQPDTIPANQTAPEAWKLVPLTMDENMQDSALEEEAKANQRGEPAAFTDLWEAIVSAAPEDVLPMPRNVGEARAMALLGHRWLKDNAPEQLTDSSPYHVDTDGNASLNLDHPEIRAKIRAQLESLKDFETDTIPVEREVLERLIRTFYAEITNDIDYPTYEKLRDLIEPLRALLDQEKTDGGNKR